MSIRNLSPYVAMHHMLTALRLGPFADNLCMQPADSLDTEKESCQVHAAGRAKRIPQPGPCQGQRGEKQGRKGPPRATESKK